VKPFLLVLSAPSGGGKTTIAKMLLQGRDDLGYSVSATTRPQRPGERDGVDYHFLSRDEFLRRRESGQFLEWATYGGELYGTLKSEIERIFAEGRHAVLDVEIEGARQIRNNFPNSLLLFVLPPSAEALMQRLMGRKTEDPDLVRARIVRAAEELSAIDEYDYAILNEDLVVAVAQVAAILEAESWRVMRQDTLPEFVEQLRRDVVRAAEKIVHQPPVPIRERDRGR
jgi:guanylate kinase